MKFTFTIYFIVFTCLVFINGSELRSHQHNISVLNDTTNNQNKNPIQNLLDELQQNEEQIDFQEKKITEQKNALKKHKTELKQKEKIIQQQNIVFQEKDIKIQNTITKIYNLETIMDLQKKEIENLKFNEMRNNVDISFLTDNVDDLEIQKAQASIKSDQQNAEIKNLKERTKQNQKDIDELLDLFTGLDETLLEQEKQEQKLVKQREELTEKEMEWSQKENQYFKAFEKFQEIMKIKLEQENTWLTKQDEWTEKKKEWEEKEEVFKAFEKSQEIIMKIKFTEMYKQNEVMAKQRIELKNLKRKIKRKDANQKDIIEKYEKNASIQSQLMSPPANQSDEQKNETDLTVKKISEQTQINLNNKAIDDLYNMTNACKNNLIEKNKTLTKSENIILDLNENYLKELHAKTKLIQENQELTKKLIILEQNDLKNNTIIDDNLKKMLEEKNQTIIEQKNEIDLKVKKISEQQTQINLKNNTIADNLKEITDNLKKIAAQKKIIEKNETNNALNDEILLEKGNHIKAQNGALLIYQCIIGGIAGLFMISLSLHVYFWLKQ